MDFRGIVAKGVARLDGNKFGRSESELTRAGVSGAYFGVNGAVKSLASIAGASQLSVSLTALIFSVSISELIKVMPLC